MQLENLAESIERGFAGIAQDEPLRVTSYFGTSPEPAFRDLVRKLFDLLPCPILEIELRYRETWEVSSLRPLSRLPEERILASADI